MIRLQLPSSPPVRVELAEGAAIQLQQQGHTGLAFEQSQIATLFEVGPMQPPRTAGRDSDVALGVTLDRDAQCLVGQVDLEREVGMHELMSVFEAAFDASVRENRDLRPRAPTDPSKGEHEQHGSREEGARLVVVTIGEAADRWAELLCEIERWQRVVRTESGRRVTLLAAWDWWSLHEHRRASLDGAYGAYRHAGKLNIVGYACATLRPLEPRAAGIEYREDDIGDENDNAGFDEQPG